MSEKLADILQGGIIVAADDDHRLLVQANGAYFNLYSEVDVGSWECVDCTANGEWGDMRTRTAAEYQDRGRDLLDQWINENCPECERPRNKRGEEWWCVTCDEGSLELMARTAEEA